MGAKRQGGTWGLPFVVLLKHIPLQVGDTWTWDVGPLGLELPTLRFPAHPPRPNDLFGCFKKLHCTVSFSIIYFKLPLPLVESIPLLVKVRQCEPS